MQGIRDEKCLLNCHTCASGSYRVVERVMVQRRSELGLFVLEQMRFCLQRQQIDVVNKRFVANERRRFALELA